MAKQVSAQSSSQLCGIVETQPRKCRIITFVIIAIFTIGAAIAVTAAIAATVKASIIIIPTALTVGVIALIATALARCGFFTKTTVTPRKPPPGVAKPGVLKKIKRQSPAQRPTSPTAVTEDKPKVKKPPRSKAELKAIVVIKELKKLVRDSIVHAQKDPDTALENIQFAISSFVIEAAPTLLACSTRKEADEMRIKELCDIFEVAHEYVQGEKTAAEVAAFIAMLSPEEVSLIERGIMPAEF